MVEGGADGLAKGFVGVGLLQDDRGAAYGADQGDDFGGVAGGEDDGNIGADGGNPLVGVGTIELRHDDVEEKKVDFLGVRFELVDSILAICGGDNVVTEFAEHFRGRIAEAVVIVGEEDGFVAAAEFDGSLGWRGIRLAFAAGEIEAEGGALPQFAIDVDETGMLLDDAVDGGKA